MHRWGWIGVGWILAAVAVVFLIRWFTAPVLPSILFITLDAVRRDHVGVYGAPWPITPTIDALARHGVVFHRVYATASWTPPTMASLLYGGTPLEHGVYHWNTPPRAPEDSWPRWLRRRYGYRTAFFTNHPGLGSKALRFAEQFETWGFYGAPARRAQFLTDAVIRWLRRQWTPRPVLLWVHYIDPHEPYNAPSPWPDYWLANTTLRIPPERAPVCARDVRFGRGCVPRYLYRHIDAEEYEPERMAARYRADIAYTDRHVGRLVDFVMGDRRRWIISITADHGQVLVHPQSHGPTIYFSHGTYLFDELLKIPWILVDTAHHRAQPEHVHILISQPDIPATLLAWAGLTPPPRWRGQAMVENGRWRQGRRWVTAWELRGMRGVVHTGTQKLLLTPVGVEYRGSGDRLLKEKPHPTLVRMMPRLRQALLQWRAPVRPVPIASELQRQLRQLGYVNP